MLFEGNLKIEEIAKNLHIGNTTLYKWRHDPAFKKALNEYSVYQFDSALPLAVRATVDIIKHGKSEKVKLEAAQTIFKRVGLFSDNGTPELDKARIRKANADADLTEAKAKALTGDNGAENKVAELMGDLREVFKETE